MDMSKRTLQDGITLVGSFHFLMAFLCLVGAIAVYIYALVPALSVGSNESSGNIFFPIIGLLVCLLLIIVYSMVGIGLIRQSNSARMAAIFLGVVGVMSGFIAVIGVVIANMGGEILPSIATVALAGLIAICAYSIVAFVDIFILIFLFNSQVRALFYIEE